jgi:hypothetical protein
MSTSLARAVSLYAAGLALFGLWPRRCAGAGSAARTRRARWCSERALYSMR